MATQDYRKLDDDDIVKLVDDNVRTTTGYSSSDLSKERKGSRILQREDAQTGTRRGTRSTFLRMFTMQYRACLQHCSKHLQQETEL